VGRTGDLDHAGMSCRAPPTKRLTSERARVVAASPAPTVQATAAALPAKMARMKRRSTGSTWGKGLPGGKKRASSSAEAMSASPGR